MTTCKEHRDDVIAITAIPVADYAIGSVQWQLQPTIATAQFAPTLSGATTIGPHPAGSGVFIPIVRDTGKSKDDESDGTPGRSHKVSVSCQVDDRDPTVWGRLLALERTPSHLLVTYRDGSRAFAAATPDSYTMTTDRDGGKASIAFKLHNLMGLQLIV